MKDTVLILKALSDKSRLRMFMALSYYEELCVCELTELLQVSGATVSKHLSILTNVNLTERRKSGRWVYYKLCKDNDSLKLLLECLKDNLIKTSDYLKDREVLSNIRKQTLDEICRKQRGIKCCPR